jgi:hypothetical protein
MNRQSAASWRGLDPSLRLLWNPESLGLDVPMATCTFLGFSKLPICAREVGNPEVGTVGLTLDRETPNKTVDDPSDASHNW